MILCKVLMLMMFLAWIQGLMRRRSFRVKKVEFWVKKGLSAHVSADSGSDGPIRRIHRINTAYCLDMAYPWEWIRRIGQVDKILIKEISPINYPIQGFDVDDVLGVLSLDSRFNAKKVMCGLMYGRGSPNDENVVLCIQIQIQSLLINKQHLMMPAALHLDEKICSYLVLKLNSISHAAKKERKADKWPALYGGHPCYKIVVDNLGAKRVMCIQALKGKKGARLGDTIVASVKEAQPGGKVKKGQVVYGVVVRAAMQKGRCDGSEVKFDDNAVVLVNKQGEPIGQDKYVAEILKKFDFASAKTASTLMETNKALIKDEEAEDVDVHLYRSMIGSLIYLTTYRPNIMFDVCACARDSPFDLEGFSDSDYAGASLDKKSTTGGCQFLGKRLISWQCKKQTIVANSTTEAEYVVAANYCGQVLWIQNQMLDYGFNFMNTKIYIDNESTICIVKNPVFQSKTKHIEIRHHFIRDSYKKKLQVTKIHTDQNVFY
ncbi:putative ribonuclease H-like domain-containing protein [Tanacetum coccineum]|uniref:Ribonuclease H-like domain-containing protein n=1 Tax=Tanacetum coccineum TaxID=301880 RepID=A0ABQ4ZNR2_9ASTR